MSVCIGWRVGDDGAATQAGATMYTVDARDRVVPITDIPRSSVGAPCPIVLAGEHEISVAFFLQDSDPAWDGTWARVVSPETPGDPAGVVTFGLTRALMFGPPNDEAFSGHPLASRGLEPYSNFEIMDSSWIRALERMNSVHPSHRPEHFDVYRHFVLAFHDRVFECVAKSYAFRPGVGPLRRLLFSV